MRFCRLLRRRQIFQVVQTNSPGKCLGQQQGEVTCFDLFTTAKYEFFPICFDSFLLSDMPISDKVCIQLYLEKSRNVLFIYLFTPPPSPQDVDLWYGVLQTLMLPLPFNLIETEDPKMHMLYFRMKHRLFDCSNLFDFFFSWENLEKACLKIVHF